MNSRVDIYEPREDTLPYRVLQYFRRLPDEELSARDIGLKFNTEPGNVHIQLKTAVDHDMLARDGSIYKAGPSIGKLLTPTMLSPTANAPSPARPKRASYTTPISAADLPDLATIPLEESVPLTGGGPGRNKVDWEQLLARMKPGQSCVLPSKALYTLRSSITARHKAGQGKFTLRNLPNDELRLWRTE